MLHVGLQLHSLAVGNAPLVICRCMSMSCLKPVANELNGPVFQCERCVFFSGDIGSFED